MRLKYSELKDAIRAGRKAKSIAANPYGPPPNYTNSRWSGRSMAMNRAWLRGFYRAADRDSAP